MFFWGEGETYSKWFSGKSGHVIEHNYTRQECLRKEEPRDPKNTGCAIVIPVLQKFQPAQQIVHITSKRFQRRVWFGSPQAWNFAIQYTWKNFFQIRRHDDQSLRQINTSLTQKYRNSDWLPVVQMVLWRFSFVIHQMHQG